MPGVCVWNSWYAFQGVVFVLYTALWSFAIICYLFVVVSSWFVGCVYRTRLYPVTRRRVMGNRRVCVWVAERVTVM